MLQAHYAVDADPGDGTAPLASAEGRGCRLNSARWTGDPLSLETDVFRGLAAAIEAECGLWNTASRRLVRRYFDWVEATVEAEKASLDAKLLSYEGLFGYRDFRFSAPRPLPRAHLHKSDGALGLVDLAFFPGDGRCIAFVGRGAMSPRADAERRVKLASAGVAVLNIGAPDSFSHILIAEGPFWTGETLPCGPLLPAVTI